MDIVDFYHTSELKLSYPTRLLDGPETAKLNRQIGVHKVNKQSGEYIIESESGPIPEQTNFLIDLSSLYNSVYANEYYEKNPDKKRYPIIVKPLVKKEEPKKPDEKPKRNQSQMKFMRGDKVNYLQNISSDLSWSNSNIHYKPVQGTYIWAVIGDIWDFLYIIQHPDGLLKSHFTNLPKATPELESYFSEKLKDDFKYIFTNKSELTLITPKSNIQKN